MPQAKRIPFKIDIPSDILSLKDAFKAAGYKLYVVGGAVRDALQGKIPKDYDLATDAVPDTVEEIAQNAGYKTLPTGKAFGVINVFTEEGEYEVATFREDIGSGRRPEGVRFADIETDVMRRDLTINALFYDIDTQEVVDLVGGVDDLKNKIVRTVGNPRDRFGEDRLRILRAVRFAGRFGSELDPETDTALMEDSSLQGVSPERIRDEFLKGIQSAKSVSAYMKMLEKYELLDQILSGLEIDYSVLSEPDMPRDPLVLLACLLKKNDAKTLARVLNQLKYPDVEVKGIVFLDSLFNLTVDTAVALKKLQKNIKLTDAQILDFAQRENLLSMVEPFLKFQLSYTAQDAVKKFGPLTGKDLGDAIQAMEKEKFLQLMSSSTAAYRETTTVAYKTKEISLAKKLLAVAKQLIE